MNYKGYDVEVTKEPAPDGARNAVYRRGNEEFLYRSFQQDEQRFLQEVKIQIRNMVFLERSMLKSAIYELEKS